MRPISPSAIQYVQEILQAMHPTILVLLQKYSVEPRGKTSSRARQLVRRLEESQKHIKPELDLWLTQEAELGRLRLFLAAHEVHTALWHMRMHGGDIFGDNL